MILYLIIFLNFEQTSRLQKNFPYKKGLIS